MRGIQHPASDLVDWTSPRLPPLTPLEMEPAQDAFVKISPDSEGDPHLPELLRELDCMPLAITLMAKLAEVGETVQELLSQWRQEQVKLLSRPDGDRRSSIEVSIRLSLMSSSVRTNTDAIALLSVLARLPGGASLTQLSTICPSISGWKAALRVLRTAALVYDSPDKTVVQMLSPIRSYILLHHPLEKGPLQDLRAAYYALADKGKAYHGDSDLDDVMTELQKEETNLDAIIIDALSNAGDKEDALVAALAYSNYLSLTQPRVNVIVAAIRAARDTGSTQLPDCLQSYGDTLRFQSQYDAALIALEEARDKFTLLGDSSSAAYCLWSIADALRVRSRYDEACSVLEKAMRHFNDLNDPVGASECLCNLGAIYEEQGNFELARSTLEEARSQLVEQGADLGIANCLRALGRVYRAQGEYEAALSIAEEAKFAHIELHDQLGTAHTLKLFSDIYYDQEAKSLFGKHHDGFSSSLGIADCDISLGKILRLQGRYDKAIELLEEARAIFSTQNSKKSDAAECNEEIESALKAQSNCGQS
ncbi:hypothetical protein FRC02_007610 [Tulasnella sp. 418]|nr:hypothetical protein FRC02_007610 [Tulasnella sp. 418]